MNDYINILSIKTYSSQEVKHILDDNQELPVELLDKIAIETALRYLNEEISYNEGDCIMDNLYSYWVNNDYLVNNYEFPKKAYECFIAFDEGEYIREGDDINIDTAEHYTKPLILNFLKKYEIIK